MNYLAGLISFNYLFIFLKKTVQPGNPHPGETLPQRRFQRKIFLFFLLWNDAAVRWARLTSTGEGGGWGGCHVTEHRLHPPHAVRAPIKRSPWETLGSGGGSWSLFGLDRMTKRPDSGEVSAALTSLVKRGTPRCQRWSFSRPLYTTFPKTAMLPDLHNVFPAGTRRKQRRVLFKRTGSSLEHALQPQDAGGGGVQAVEWLHRNKKQCIIDC